MLTKKEQKICDLLLVCMKQCKEGNFDAAVCSAVNAAAHAYEIHPSNQSNHLRYTFECAYRNAVLAFPKLAEDFVNEKTNLELVFSCALRPHPNFPKQMSYGTATMMEAYQWALQNP